MIVRSSQKYRSKGRNTQNHNTMKNTTKNIMLTGSLVIGSAIGLSGLNAQAGESLSYTDLGSGSELRSELLHSPSADLRAYEMSCGEATKTEAKKDSKSKEMKCGEGKCGEKKAEKKDTDKTKDAKADVKSEKAQKDSKSKEAKCGEGKCGEGKCGVE